MQANNFIPYTLADPANFVDVADDHYDTYIMGDLLDDTTPHQDTNLLDNKK